MPKMKGHGGAKKRLHLTGSGHIKRKQAGKNHKLGYKKPKTIRNLRKKAVVSKTQEDTMKRLIQG